MKGDHESNGSSGGEKWVVGHEIFLDLNAVQGVF